MNQLPENLTNCPVCNNRLDELAMPIGAYKESLYVKCTRCAEFIITEEGFFALASLKKSTSNQWPKLSHFINTRFRKNFPVSLKKSDVEDVFRNTELPTFREQSDNLIRYIAENFDEGQIGDLSDKEAGGIIGCMSAHSLMLAAKELAKEGFLSICQPFSGGVQVQLGLKGWDRYHDLKRGDSDSTKAFMAMPFGNEELDQVVDTVFRPAVKETGFNLLRLDDVPRAGLIDDRLRVEIQSSRFLISDITHANLGAYWEAGYAEGLGKPVIYTCRSDRFVKSEEGPGAHFDTNHHLTVMWDPNDLKLASESLKATIRATIPDALREKS